MTEREDPQQRVRVTGPSRPRVRQVSGPRRRQIDAQSPQGEIYLRSLVRDQLRQVVVTLFTLVLTLGSLPLLFHLSPSLAEARILDVPLPWLLLGVLVYPFLVVLGWRHLRAAERIERGFADLVETRERS